MARNGDDELAGGAITVSDDVVERMGRAWRELRRGAATTVVRDRMFGTDDEAIEPGHMDVLDVLDGPWRMGDVAARLRVDPSTITRTIQRMEIDGLVERTPDLQDRRVVTVAATPAGRRIHGEVAQRRSDILQRVLAPLDPAQRRQLVDLLDRFIDSLDDYVRNCTV